MLDQLAQPDPAGMRTHRYVEPRGQQVDGQDLVHAAQPGHVELAIVAYVKGLDGLGLKRYLEIQQTAYDKVPK